MILQKSYRLQVLIMQKNVCLKRDEGHLNRHLFLRSLLLPFFTKRSKDFLLF